MHSVSVRLESNEEALGNIDARPLFLSPEETIFYSQATRQLIIPQWSAPQDGGFSPAGQFCLVVTLPQ